MTNLTPNFTPAERISSFKPYFFATLGKKLAELKSKGMDVIRIDIGSPDLPPADFIVDSLVSSARRSDTHGYSPNGGTPAFRKAIVDYYMERFEVELDPQKEVLGLIGSKEGLFNLCQVLLNPGDISLVPDPGYPVYSAGSIIAGAEIVSLPLLKENGFLPNLKAIDPSVLTRAKIIWLNYPNNPTGAVATMAFYEEAVAFAREHNILIAHDAPYCDVTFDGYNAPSILQVPGARDVTVEFNSLSKTYNMAGWRLGMAVGNAQVINYLSTYKSQMDTSTFIPVFDAGVTALTSDQGWLSERNAIYRERRDIIVEGLRKAGFTLETPQAAIYVWAQLPNGCMDSMTFCSRMLDEIGVSTTPGVVYGQHGEGFLRISLGQSTDRISEAVQRIENWKY
jgi:LL-diaminopimelate aminotransferase